MSISSHLKEHAILGVVNSVSTVATVQTMIDAAINVLDPQESVKDMINTPPVSPADGDRYIITSVATGDWATHEEKIAQWDDSESTWTLITPDEGTSVWVDDEDTVYVYDSSHPAGTWTAQSAFIDHGTLLGRNDDDHTQYALLAGRSGGQTLYGGIDASDNLNIYSTSNASKGYIILNDPSKIKSPSYFENGVTAYFGDVSTDVGVIKGNITTDEFLFCSGDETGRQFVFTDAANRNKDHDHAIPTNPTIFGHSAIDPDTDNTQWWSLTHDQTDSVANSGKGDWRFDCGLTTNSSLKLKTVIIDHTDSPYTILSTDYKVYADTSGGEIDIVIPSSIVALGRTILIKDTGDNSSVNNIDITTQASELIEFDAAGLTMNQDGMCITLGSDGTDWYIE